MPLVTDVMTVSNGMGGEPPIRLQHRWHAARAFPRTKATTMPAESEARVMRSVTFDDLASGWRRGSLGASEFSRNEATIMPVESEARLVRKVTANDPPSRSHHNVVAVRLRRTDLATRLTEGLHPPAAARDFRSDRRRGPRPAPNQPAAEPSRNEATAFCEDSNDKAQCIRPADCAGR